MIIIKQVTFLTEIQTLSSRATSTYHTDNALKTYIPPLEYNQDKKLIPKTNKQNQNHRTIFTRSTNTNMIFPHLVSIKEKHGLWEQEK